MNSHSASHSNYGWNIKPNESIFSAVWSVGRSVGWLIGMSDLNCLCIYYIMHGNTDMNTVNESAFFQFIQIVWDVPSFLYFDGYEILSDTIVHILEHRFQCPKFLVINIFFSQAYKNKFISFAIHSDLYPIQMRTSFHLNWIMQMGWDDIEHFNKQQYTPI